MADVFLSYARSDREIAGRVKAGLEAAGLSVFFDVDGLDGGDVFPDVLDREVKGAGAVVSLWSTHALSRPWVKQECSIGLKRKCLIPVAIERLGELDVPVAFEGLQQIDFTGFHGRTDGADWQKLMRALARTLGRPELVAGPVPQQKRAVAPVPDRPGPKANGLWLLFGALAVTALGAIAANQFLTTNEIAALEEPADPADSATGEAAEAAPETLSEAAPAEPEAPAAAPEGVTFADEGCGDATARVYFNFDRTDLNPASVSALEEALTRRFGCDLIEVRIEAHDDLLSSPSYAEAVSRRRADAVAQWLTAQGVEDMWITRIGYGSSQPLAPGVKSPFNRRADVVFDYAEPLPADAPSPLWGPPPD